MNELFRLLNEFSQRLGGKYLETSEAGVESTPSAIRSRTRDFSDARNNSDLEQTRVFPIRPKDDPGLVRLWFRYILPALHKVLSPSIGGTYAATLVRRGQRRISTEPCIQIESPRIPGQKAKSIIRHSLNDICQRSNHQLVSIRFLQGTVKRLSGGMEEDDDDVGESPESQRLKFNLFRPFSKPRMGSSLGLKCSQESSATLGGYVLIGVDKYMLTSEHFVARSQEPANVDGDDTDLVTITSPSRQDLNSMENDLKQTKRDLYSQIDQQTKEIYGNRDIPAGDEAFPLDDLHNKIDNVTSLLEQVKKPPHAYAIGTVFRRSIEPKKGPLERSIARAIGLEDDVREYMYHMDWALCKLNDQISRNGENRHKYQSDQVAMTEDYIEEDNYNHQAGDVCHETCEVESGVSVFYIGRGSRRRSGVVNLPGFISRNSVKTLDWGIMSSDGQGINSSDVEADSGAWVVRQSDNKVVGQVHSYSSRQVLFTPIDVIFDDIKEDVEEDVCLPPHQGGTGQIVIATDAIALCSGPNTSPPKSYKFLMPSIKALESPPRLLAVEAAQSETPPPEPPRISEIQDVPIHEQTQDASGPPADSTSLLPSLTTSPQSPATVPASPETPPPLELADQSDVQTDQLDEQLLSESLPTIRSHLKFPESPAATDKRRGLQGLKLLAYQLQHGTPIHLRLRATRRTSTWPVVRESKISKVHLKGSAFVRHPRSRDHVPGTSHEEAQRFARRIGTSIHHSKLHSKIYPLTAVIEDIGDIKLPAGNKIRVSKGKVRISPMLEDIGERGSSPIPEYSSVAA